MFCKDCKYFKFAENYKGQVLSENTFGKCTNEKVLIVDWVEFEKFEQDHNYKDDMLFVDNSDDPYTYAGIFVGKKFGCVHFLKKN